MGEQSVNPQHRNAKTNAKRETEKIEALRLWMAGTSFRSIGEKLGVSGPTAYRRVRAALDEMRPHADFEAYRAVQLAELEVSRRVLRNVIASWRPGQPFGEATLAISTLLKLQEREGQLVGLDRAPTPFDEIAAMTDEQLTAMVAAWSAGESPT